LAALLKAAELPGASAIALDNSEKNYRGALANDPKSPAARYDLAIALKMQDRIDAAQKESQEAFATGARLKREEGQLADALEQPMRGRTFPKPLSSPPR
jgi:hypothetical protein